MSKVIFLTGATGFLGAQVARRLIAEADGTIIALVRGHDGAEARRRLQRAWWSWPELADAIGGRVEVLCGDVSAPQLGLNAATYQSLVRRVTHIIHTAAEVRVDRSLAELRRVNVQGTANVLDLARAASRDHGLARFAHISTAYVAGGRRGEVPEDALSAAYGFATAYERTKYEAELLVQAAQADLPVSVFRPGMIAGDSRTGEITTFNTFYLPLRLYLTGKLRVLPASPALRVNIVPVDYVADAVARLTFDPRAQGVTFHLTAPHSTLPTAAELIAAVREWARERLGVRLPPPLFLPLPRWLLRAGQGLRGIAALAPYFQEQRQFRRDNTDRLLGPYPIRWRELVPPLLSYAARQGFLHRSERTVHEQILFRLQSRSRPVTYHDVAGGQITARSAQEVRGDMLAAVRALRTLGVGPGDRVAMVGLNSSRYLALDVAIGLVGAVSVPLYYTSPMADMDAILKASGARLLLVGSPDLLPRLGELAEDVPVISFCREPLPANLPRPVMPWEGFLTLEQNQAAGLAFDRRLTHQDGSLTAKGAPDFVLGAGKEASATAPIGPGDLATIRYTSGTTSRPKGVTFNHAQLRWMGECLPSLLPWHARTAPLTYLSCLPMNHVVEGILATYAPYYIPAPVDIYFLEDLHDLARTLPRVRPTVFFSVPRVYEKIWERLASHPIGRLYRQLPAGLARRLLRPLIRRQLLQSAGLDRCRQLITGSAPAGEGLLHDYRELGIEVHNAYGLTEAPLVALNRLGRNRLGTVGEPLPETEVRIAADGEVLVRGLQVTMGYFNPEDGIPFREGWLLTGDMGRLTPDGSLVIWGRRKELIATSYGKKISPQKVESLLREIPGIEEAMLVGESKPFCTALLWVSAHHDPFAIEALDHAVQRVNAHLAHPEQVKLWAVLPNDLSIEGGDLTANLKLKRQAVAQRLQGVLDALYGAGDMPAGVLHLGQAGHEGAS